MAAATAWAIHNDFKLRRGSGLIDLTSHTFKLGLASSTSNISDLTVGNYANITNELPTANGYTIGGVALTGVSWSGAGAIFTFTANNAAFVAAGGSIVCRYGFIYDDTDVAKTIVCHSLLDSAPADVTVTDTNTLTINVSANGIFTEQ